MEPEGPEESATSQGWRQFSAESPAPLSLGVSRYLLLVLECILHILRSSLHQGVKPRVFKITTSEGLPL